MTVSLEDKIELFRNTIFKDIEESASLKQHRAKESFEQEKSRLLQEVEVKKNHIICEAEKKAERERQQLIAKEKSQGYHKLLDKRQQFVNEVLELLVQEAKNFVSEEGYKEYLSKNLVKAADIFENSGLVQLYFTKRDLEALGELISQSAASGELKGRYRLKEAAESIIGGFYAEDENQEIQVDYTLKSLIEENRELIGNNISRRLDEVQHNG